MYYKKTVRLTYLLLPSKGRHREDAEKAKMMMAQRKAASARDDDDETTVVRAQRPDEIFERMRPPEEDGEGSIVHENGMVASSSMTSETTTTWLEKARTRTGITRKECHATKTWHRSAHVWVFDKERNKVILQRRSDMKDTFPGMWDVSAAGHIEFDPETQEKREDKDVDDDDDDECVDEADKHSRHPNSSRNTACREVAEELGIRVDPKQLTYAFTCAAKQADAGGCNAYEDVYFMYGDSSKDVAESFPALGKAEVSQVAWFSWDAVYATWHKEYFNTPRTHQKSNSPLLYDDNASDKRIAGAKLVPRHELYVKTLDDMFKSVHVVSAGKVSRLKTKFENARDGRLLASPLKKKPEPPPKKKT